MKRTLLALVALLMLVSVSAFAQVQPVPQLMNFQGRLTKPDGTPVADGNYSLRFSLHDALSGGVEKWNQTVNPVTVHNGTFAVLLNTSTGAADKFNSNLYLQIQIGTDAPLTPRQQLVSVAYAMKANSVPDGSITSASIADGTITAADIASGMLNSLSWLLNGNSGTNSATQFIGTTDNKPLNFRVNNTRALRLEWVTGTTLSGINMLGGYPGNNITPGATIATIGGGGYSSVDGGSIFLAYNRVTDTGGTVGGGANNRAGDNSGNTEDSIFATVCGGAGNRAAGDYAFIGGGYYNEANGDYTTIAGGRENAASANYTTVGGGINNTAYDFYTTVAGGSGNDAHDDYATVSGGYSNFADGQYSVISGGYNNAIGAGISTNYATTIAGGANNFAELDYATVSGGSNNIASGSYATVPGGYNNAADADYSFAAGRRAKANNTGAFVWADSNNADFASTATNQFNVRASGGIRLFTSSGLTAGVTLTAGDSTWNSVSDRNAKTNFQTVDVEEILNKLAALPLTTWNYKTNTDIRHIGVMAQDFYAAFGGLGMDDKHISTVDADGIAFAAIQGLHHELQTIKAENAALKQQLSELTALVRQVKAAQETLRANQTHQ